MFAFASSAAPDVQQVKSAEKAALGTQKKLNQQALPVRHYLVRARYSVSSIHTGSLVRSVSKSLWCYLLTSVTVIPSTSACCRFSTPQTVNQIHGLRHVVKSTLTHIPFYCISLESITNLERFCHTECVPATFVRS